MTLKLEQNERGVILSVRAQPGSRKNAILGVREGALRVAVTAAPEKGKANRAIATLLAEAIGVAKSSVALISGELSQNKRFLILGIELNQLRSSLLSTIE
jgi:uncharacterized protein (TIGR00251 family)